MRRLMQFRMKRRRKGQALVEFALIIPIFLLLVLGVFEFGRAWNVYQVLDEAVRVGARNAVLYNSLSAQQKQDSAAVLMNANMAAAVKTFTGVGVAGGSTTVAIQYPYQLRWIQSFMGWTGLQASFSMNANVTFRNEY